VGILEDFYTKHPDFGRGGFFAIMASAPFAWPNADDQRPYMREKVQWLVDHGYEIGNHTIDHVNLREISNEEVKAQLAGAVEIMRGYAPKAQMEIIAVPFGVYPKGGNTTLFEGFDYQGKHYGFQAALMVGANPGPAPVSKAFDPMWIPRIRGSQAELAKWFDFVEANSGMLYVSDGNPNTITVPQKLAPALSETLDITGPHGKTLVRY
jgi:peptidoglycan/xylan/chitin deacetylase (PgdA/CDA1 family)